MRLDNSPVSGPGAGWAAAVPPIQTKVHRPAGNPFGGPALGRFRELGENSSLLHFCFTLQEPSSETKLSPAELGLSSLDPGKLFIGQLLWPRSDRFG